ncbi:MAG: 16S rRNA (guanine(527)-N(7))-methyltransferase RsmG [Candidatus Peribacteria bacterium]|jgi:16S rRNA (guanine527-N7)-methyltransferase|nr:16S rRNA (guanine(527)-N(7))-methyltransferase RsmG [Candidatus Peribacteria bacterium]
MINNWSPLIQIFLEKNTQLNLSAIRDEEGIFIKHIQDSLEINKILTFTQGVQVADVGTGGGFPLLPLAMTNPQANFTGIDSVKKKTVAVNEMIQSLHITNAEVLRTRIENPDVFSLRGEMSTPQLDAREQAEGFFDYIVARAVAYVDKLIPRSYHLLKKGGHFILMKQINPQEREKLLQIAKERNLILEKEHKYSLFDEDIERVIYVLKK